MKKHTWLLAIAFCTGFFACNGGGEENGDNMNLPEELKGYVQLALTEHGLPLVLMIPDTTVGMPEVTVQPYGETEIKVGNYFQIKIAEGGDIALKRADLDEDLLYKTAYLEEEPNAIMYKSALPDGSQEFFHFYAVVNINGIDYEVEDIIGGGKFSEISIKRMMESAKFMQPAMQESSAEEGV